MQASKRLAPLAVGVLCGIAAGAIAGLWARIAMRMVALGVADGVGVGTEFTVPGTLLIVVTGALVGAPAGILYGVVADRLPGPARWRGLLYAALLLVVVGPFFFRIEEFFSRGRVLLFIPPFVLYGAIVGLMLAPVRARIARIPLPAQAFVAVVGLGTTALLVFAIAVSALGLPGFVM